MLVTVLQFMLSCVITFQSSVAQFKKVLCLLVFLCLCQSFNSLSYAARINVPHWFVAVDVYPVLITPIGVLRDGRVTPHLGVTYTTTPHFLLGWNQICIYVRRSEKLKKLKNWKLHYINPKGKFMLSPQEQTFVTSMKSVGQTAYEIWAHFHHVST